MKCKKKVFYSSTDAIKRAGQINSENIKTKKKQLIPYKCDVCGNYHLTKMTKHQYKYKNNPKYRIKINEESFIKRESRHWEDYYGL